MNSLITGNVKFYSQTANKEYIDLLRKYPAYTPEEENAAFERLKNGDETARDEIALHNQRWVYSLAKEYAMDEIEVMDYVSEGNFGLLEAIEKFDATKGFKFITFAVWYIRRAMNSYMINDREMITKSNNAKLFKKLDKVKNDYFLKNGFMPSNEVVKEILKEKYGIDIVNKADLYDLDIFSISDGVGGLKDNNTTYEDMLPTFVDSFLEREEDKVKEDDEHYKELVGPILGCLPEKQREFIKKIYHIGYDETYTFDKICAEYGLDAEGLKNMEDKILKYMKQEMLDFYKKAI